MEKDAIIKEAVNEAVANGKMAMQLKVLMAASMSDCTASQIKNKDTSCIKSNFASGQGRGGKSFCFCILGFCLPPGC